MLSWISAIIGKLHEIVFYGLLMTLLCLARHKLTRDDLKAARGHVKKSVRGVFTAFLAWSTLLYIPIGLVSAISTLFIDMGAGLTFSSNNLVTIFFAHIAEEIQGLIHNLKDTKDINYLKEIADQKHKT